MRAEDFELLYRLEEKHWWFAAMRQITDTIAASELAEPKRKILDAGCGTGFNLSYYTDLNSHDVYGLDIANAALEHVLMRGIDKEIQYSINAFTLKSIKFDVYFSF